MAPNIGREVEKSCFTPRDYQVELLDKACKKNTIVQLGTGAGKTFIAVMLLKEYALHITPPFSEGGKRAFFIVDKVTLVHQQAEHIECHTVLSVGKMSGNENSDKWNDREEFECFLEQHNVVVITAQVFLNLLDHAFFNLSRCAVLIFDECHHAMGTRHPYRLIMSRYMSVEEDLRPRVLGLTASLIKDKTPPILLEAKLAKLENILNCTIETASDLVSLSKYGAKPTENIVICLDYSVNADVSSNILEILEILNDFSSFVSGSNDFNPDFDIDPRKPIVEALLRTKAVTEQIGPWAAWKLCMMFEKDLKKVKQSFLPPKAIDYLIMGETCMNMIRKLLEPKMKPLRFLNDLKLHLPNKVARLLDILLAYSPDNQRQLGIQEVEPLSAIIFVEQRYVACILSTLLVHVSKNDSRFKFVHADYMIGYSSGTIANDDGQGLHKRQERVLRNFRRGELNVLVATNVLEEGVDVRNCNVVIKFDKPLDYRAYVQSKGRARKPGANYFILVEQSENTKCSDDIRDFVEIEKLLLRRCKSVHNPNDYDFAQVDNLDSLYPPYRVELTGAQVTMSTAIALVNRYCSKLPSDIFTRLVPQNQLIPTECGGVVKYKAKLLLPINSPLKEPIRLETPMANKKIAQMAVALKACELLHKKGELNDHLLPVGKESIAGLLSHIDDDPDEYAPGVNAKVGSARRRQLYDKKVALALHKALPSSNIPCYVYALEMELLKEISDEYNPKRRKFARPELCDYSFGFLSVNKLPAIPPFSVYLRQGDMRVKVIQTETTVAFDEKELNEIRNFHHYLFKNVLQLAKSSIEFQNDALTPVNTLVVPLNRVSCTNGTKKYTVNMKYVSEVVSSMEEMPRVPNEEVRKTYKFRAEDYKDAVVMPWYRNTEQPVFYFVAEVIDNMNPSSPFPDNDFMSFNEYFIKKYNLPIYDQEQSLLDVDYTSNRLNLLLPRASYGMRKKIKPEGTSQQQIFVPELLDVHPISASLWSLIAALPSCFYRLNHLLLADEFRQKTMQVLDSSSVVPLDYRWEPLTYPVTYEEKQSLIVSKIQQLRVQNKVDINPIVSRPAADGEFEIGVWDPELGCPSEDDPLKSHDVTNNDDYESVGLISNVTGDLSDEDDDSAMVMFDFAKYLAEKADRLNGFAEPRNDIVQSGWPDLDDVSSKNDVNGSNWGDLADQDPAVSFQIIDGSSNTIDINSLMSDVVSKINPGDMVSSSNSSGIVKTETQITHNNRNVSNISGKLSMKPFEKFEDRDRVSKDEVIDLSCFEDPEDINSSPALTSTSECSVHTAEEEFEAEFRALEDGERKKRAIDEMFSERETVTEGAILVPELKSNFSFAKPSLFNCPSESTGNDLMHLNPYGVSPCILLNALTTASANDGINLERLETIGDSFLKYAVTDSLYHSHFDQHEGKLSFARSKEVSNCNLYRLGKKLGLPSLLVASKFDVQDSWLPPCYIPVVDFKAPNTDDAEERDKFIDDVLDGNEVEVISKPVTGWDIDENNGVHQLTDEVETINFSKPSSTANAYDDLPPLPYNLLTQQYISDKSIADAVEAVIGAHLLTLGPHPTLKVMKWIGLKVLEPDEVITQPPLLRFVDSPEDPNLSKRQLNEMYNQFRFRQLEDTIGYHFKDKAYLIQAFTHASYYKNRITGCYQRLEFLGDAVLDYMITRFLYEDRRQYSPGVLTDLRSALVNNTIFASLAVKYNFHKYFVAMCPGLHHMIEKFVKLCADRNFFDANFNSEMYMITTEEEIDEGQEEDIEVPKALSDVFESLTGAIYLDSGRDLDVVWRVVHHLMKQTIEECCSNPPRSPIRELLELEPGRTRFSKMERIIESGKIRVTVEVGINKMRFTGMGRNYRIAKTTAAKRALRYLKSLEEQKLRARKV